MTNNHFYYLKKIDGFLYHRLIIYITKMADKPWRMDQVEGLPDFSGEREMAAFLYWLAWLYDKNLKVYHLLHVLYGKHDHRFIQCQHETDELDRCELANGMENIRNAWEAFKQSFDVIPAAASRPAAASTAQRAIREPPPPYSAVEREAPPPPYSAVEREAPPPYSA
jgi:hypothetical protein